MDTLFTTGLLETSESPKVYIITYITESLKQELTKY